MERKEKRVKKCLLGSGNEPESRQKGRRKDMPSVGRKEGGIYTKEAG